MTDETAPRPVSVLFVCLGNICRSPLAEGIFLHLLEERGLRESYHVDSAGTGGWHVGEPPDRRSADVADRHGVRLVGSARQVRAEDFHEFGLILAMDSANVRDLAGLAPNDAGSAKLVLLRNFDPLSDGDADVPDPYYGGVDGFEHVFQMVHRSCVSLLDALEKERAG